MSAEDATAEQVHHAAPMGLAWKGVRYSLKLGGKCGRPKRTKTILNGCDGSLPPGRLLAVMGPSGSGKTSFLNVLADRVPKNSGASVQGEVLVGGVPRTQLPSFSRIASYVLQDDSLYPMLTVYETLILAARFRLPARLSLAAKRARVEALIDELGIRGARDTLIGDQRHKGVSGGERKRTNVGVEIIGDPSLVFLDEPTSGLDAFQALNVMQLLTALARDRGRTIVVSIHQPRSSIYQLFDRLMLLASGRVVYEGEAKEAVDYFGALGHACPVHFNPADFFIDLISVDTNAADKGEKDDVRISKLCDVAEKNRLEGKAGGEGGESSNSVVGGSAANGMSRMGGDWDCSGKFHSSVFEQFTLLYVRSLRSRLRDKPALIAPIASAIFFALVFGALYSQMGRGQKSIQDRTGALFFVTINQAFGGVFGVANSFPLEKKIVDRERTAGAYAVLPYYMSKWLAEFPFAATGPTIFSCVAYWVVGFVPEPDNFVVFLGTIIMVNMTAVAWGMVISSAVNSVEAATGLGPLVVIVFLLFGGFYVNTDNIPSALTWISEVSFFKYGFKALALNEYKDLTFVNAEGTPCSEIAQLNISSGPQACAFVDGQQVLNLLTFDTGSVGECVLYLVIITAVVHTLAYLCLLSKRQKFAPLEPPEASHKLEVGTA